MIQVTNVMSLKAELGRHLLAFLKYFFHSQNGFKSGIGRQARGMHFPLINECSFVGFIMFINKSWSWLWIWFTITELRISMMTVPHRFACLSHTFSLLSSREWQGPYKMQCLVHVPSVFLSLLVDGWGRDAVLSFYRHIDWNLTFQFFPA